MKLHGIVLFCMLLMVPAALAAVDTDLSLSWTWNEGNQIPIGTRVSSVTLKLTNQGKNRIRLEFVGVHLDWMDRDFFCYGSGS